MVSRDGAPLSERSSSLGALCVMMLIILLVQLWLLSVAVEARIAGHADVTRPSFIASGACFLVNLWLLRWVLEIDRAVQKERTSELNR